MSRMAPITFTLILKIDDGLITGGQKKCLTREDNDGKILMLSADVAELVDAQD